MPRTAKRLLVLTVFALVVGASFAGGRHLRRIAAPGSALGGRITSLADAGISLPDASGATPNENRNPADTFLEVQRFVKSEYVEHISDDRKLAQGTVRAMLMSLDDPKTRYYDPGQKAVLDQQLSGSYGGIGAVLGVIKQKKNGIDQRRLAVIAPVPGGPAEKADLHAGDVVTEVDGKWVIAYDPRLDLDRLHVSSMNETQYRQAFRDATKKLVDGVALPRALEVLGTGAGQPLTLTVERPGTTGTKKVVVTRAATTVTPVEFRSLTSRVGYLRVSQFNNAATAEVEKALTGAKVSSLIVDLRNNPGGPETEARSGVTGTATALLAHLGVDGVVGAEVRKGNRRVPLQVKAASSERRSVVVLVNRGTANFAEMVAAALREKAGAKLVGSATFGDGTLQLLVPLSGGSAMTVTAGHLLTANGTEIGRKALTPDIAVATGGPRTEGDTAVERALRALNGA